MAERVDFDYLCSCLDRVRKEAMYHALLGRTPPRNRAQVERMLDLVSHLDDISQFRGCIDLPELRKRRQDARSAREHFRHAKFEKRSG